MCPVRVLFILPNVSEFGVKPIGISLLSAICKRCGHTVGLFDTTFLDFPEAAGCINNSAVYAQKNLTKSVDYAGYGVSKQPVDLRDALHQRLREFRPDVCAFSVMTSERNLARELADGIKVHDAKLPVIWGGIYPTSSPEEAIAHASVDYICIYEGIEALPELLDALEHGRDTSRIRNIYAKQAGTILRNEVRPKVEDVDGLPYLDWDIYDPRKFLRPFKGRVIRGGEFMSIIGCPNRCTYCINNWLNQHDRRIRFYSPARAIAELKSLKEEHQLEFLTFRDDDFLLRPMQALIEFMELYRHDVALPFSIQTNARSVTAEKVELLKEMGIDSVNIGVESGSEQIRQEVLRRRDTLAEVRRAFALFNAARIETHALNMIGLPFGTRETIFETIELNRELRPTISYVSIFYPFERTALYDLCVEKEWFDPRGDRSVDILRFSALDLPELSRETIEGLNRCFALYTKLPKSFWPLIERAEVDDPTGEELFAILSTIHCEHVLERGGHFEE